ncbi:hypothetical protein AVEN_50043-1 [Araneus ventricosus]|uniref:Uncharacterized protein n=1 Tax=Araneus ventricosus TaxID=182803 RepID=A0A4Y2X8K9_ARAVE|nr:hypothetical protein AVEN_50043-1 [Araneus ventricosus]
MFGPNPSKGCFAKCNHNRTVCGSATHQMAPSIRVTTVERTRPNSACANPQYYEKREERRCVEAAAMTERKRWRCRNNVWKVPARMVMESSR